MIEPDWRTKAFVVGGAVGAALGLMAAYIYINSVDDEDAPPKLPPSAAVGIGLSLLALLRQIAALPEGDKGGQKKRR